jgi:phenylalanyl-tRNA synthetase beta chain
MRKDVMNISLNWLTDYVDVTMPAEHLGELLTRIGFSCDGIVETENDVIFNLEITSNRPDLLGHLGVAREIAAATGAPYRPPAVGKLPTRGKVEDLTSVEVLDADLCPRYTARVIRGVRVAPSPRWMVERLEAVGLRGINNIVDVTNYVLMEYSQPLHSFDYDKLAENRIVVRRAREGELLVSIDETKCHLDAEMLIIADAVKPIAVAGVMGGLDTEVSDRTTNVLIESAQFDPLVTRRTARKLQLMSESNYRFERGVDPVGVDAASLRACQLILETAGGKLAEGVADAWARPHEPAQVSLRPTRTSCLLGLDVPEQRQLEILQRLGLSPTSDGGRIVCTVPSYRGDLTREADLIEEVARMVGYDEIPVFHEVRHPVTPESRQHAVRRELNVALRAAGFDEAMTYTFVRADEAELFAQRQTLHVDPRLRRTSNVLRATLLPSLLGCCKANLDAGNADVSLYELAAVFVPAEGRELPDEHVELAMVTTGGLRELRGALEAVVGRIAPAARLEVRPAQAPGLEPSASAEMLLDAAPLGRIGLVARNVLDFYGLTRQRIAAAAASFDVLLAKAEETRTYEALAKYPPVQRDLSVVVDESVTWNQLAEVIEAVPQPTRVSAEYVTTYRGKPIPRGRKSVTVALTYRSAAGTLRSEDVDEQVAEVVKAASKHLAAELRA